MTEQSIDIMIIGAGVSGIGVACHLKQKCPHKRIKILERRQEIGGTWDLFKYPGIRSDSDMLTFGYAFRPWKGNSVLADGPSIKAYVKETAQDFQIFDLIDFGCKVLSANWDSQKSLWTIKVQIETTDERIEYQAQFLINASGYYDQDEGYCPKWPGMESFKGQIIHPQQWPEDLNYSGKQVIIIGSGATAVTLLPAMADEAGHITMLQRSPGYIASIPSVDKWAMMTRRFLPEQWAYKLFRLKYICRQQFLYWISQKQPEMVRKNLFKRIKKVLGEQVDMAHFTPKYNPWDQRLCAVPDQDLFKALLSEQASVVTDEIASFSEKGIRLISGQELEADIIITATGLNIKILGNVELSVDGSPIDLKELVTYKGLLLEGVPNSALIFGYINASWTLRVDIASDYLCRLLNHMDRSGYKKVVALDSDHCKTTDTIMGGLKSGYVQRGYDYLPKQGSKPPWKVHDNYFKDFSMFRFDSIKDEHLHFS